MCSNDAWEAIREPPRQESSRGSPAKRTFIPLSAGTRERRSNSMGRSSEKSVLQYIYYLLIFTISWTWPKCGHETMGRRSFEKSVPQCPSIFTIWGHYKWDFSEVLPMRSRNPLKRELPPQMKTFCTISRTCIWFSLIKLNELGLCRTSMKTFCTICRICSEKGLGFGVKKKIFTISRICSEKKPRRGFRV